MDTPGLPLVGDGTGASAKEKPGSHGNKKKPHICLLQPEKYASFLIASVKVPSELSGHQRVT